MHAPEPLQHPAHPFAAGLGDDPAYAADLDPPAAGAAASAPDTAPPGAGDEPDEAEVEAGFRFGRFGVDRWLRTVPGGYLRGTVQGRAPGGEIPAVIREHELLRQIYAIDLALFVGAERAGVTASAGLLRLAPDEASMKFLATQVLDEARHFEAFATRSAELGVSPSEREKLALDLMPPAYRRFLDGLVEVVDAGDFLGGVVGLNVILEGMAFPLYEYEARYWRPFDPAFVQVIEGAYRDECRHVGYGEKLLQHRLRHDPGARRHVERRVRDFARLLREAFGEFIASTVAIYDAAIREHPERAAQVEVVPGKTLLETPTGEQIAWLQRQTEEGHARRLGRLGLAA